MNDLKRAAAAIRDFGSALRVVGPVLDQATEAWRELGRAAQAIGSVSQRCFRNMGELEVYMEGQRRFRQVSALLDQLNATSDHAERHRIQSEIARLMS